MVLALILCGTCWTVPQPDYPLGNKPWPQFSSAISPIPDFLASSYAVDLSSWLFKLPPLFLLQFHGISPEMWRPELHTVLKQWAHLCFYIAAKLCLLSCSKIFSDDVLHFVDFDCYCTLSSRPQRLARDDSKMPFLSAEWSFWLQHHGARLRLFFPDAFP